MGPYFRCVDPCFFPFSCLLLSVGAFSGLFHATLSYAGQLLDEWSVLLINIYTLAVWCPDEWLRRGVTREKFTARMIGATILVMPLGIIVPTINAPLLLLFSIAHIMSIKQVMRGVRSCEIKRIGRAGITSFLFGFFCWINDRLLCDFWTESFESLGLSYPQLHAFWHLGVATSAFLTAICYSYAKAEAQGQAEKVKIRYFAGIVPWLKA